MLMPRKGTVSTTVIIIIEDKKMTEKKDWHKATLGDKATIRDAIKKLSASSLQIILVIEENNSVTLLHPNQKAILDEYGNLIINVNK